MIGLMSAGEWVGLDLDHVVRLGQQLSGQEQRHQHAAAAFTRQQLKGLVCDPDSLHYEETVHGLLDWTHECASAVEACLAPAELAEAAGLSEQVWRDIREHPSAGWTLPLIVPERLERCALLIDVLQERNPQASAADIRLWLLAAHEELGGISPVAHIRRDLTRDLEPLAEAAGGTLAGLALRPSTSSATISSAIGQSATRGEDATVPVGGHVLEVAAHRGLRLIQGGITGTR